MAEESGGIQDQHPLVGELMKPSPSLPFDLIRRKEDGSEEAYPFRCRLLRFEQQIESLIDARKYAATILKIDPQNTSAIESSSVFREAQAVEIALRSCVQSERRRRGDGTEIDIPLFTSASHMRNSLLVSEIAQMLNAIEITKAFYGISDLSEEKVEAMIDQLANEMMGGYFLSQLDSEEWPRLIFTLASLARSWRPDRPPIHSSSPNSSESTPQNSESGTTGFSRLPAARVAGSPLSGTELPTSALLSKDQARELVKGSLDELAQRSLDNIEKK